MLNAFKTARLLQRIDQPTSQAVDHSSLPSEPLFAGYSEINKYAISVYERGFNYAVHKKKTERIGTENEEAIRGGSHQPNDERSTKLGNSRPRPHEYPDRSTNRQFDSNERIKNYGDITKIKAEDLPDFDCLVGGFPCQAFSIAGKRKGFEDTRGTLFFDLARILRAKQPRLFVFENVKGLLSHDSGQTFKTIIATLDELGYDLQWQVLNSKDFGVPQNRERVFIVGHLRGTPRPEVFPIEGGNGNHIKEITSTMPQAQRVYDERGIAPACDTGQGGNRQAKTVAQRGRYKDDGTTEQRFEPRSDDLTNTLTSVQKDNLVAKTVRAGGRKSPHGSKQNWDSYKVKGVIRRLTPKECERLQGFPDDWTRYGMDEQNHVIPISDTQRYKMCGNAVTTNVVQAVFEKIMRGENNAT